MATAAEPANTVRVGANANNSEVRSQLSNSPRVWRNRASRTKTGPSVRSSARTMRVSTRAPAEANRISMPLIHTNAAAICGPAEDRERLGRAGRTVAESLGDVGKPLEQLVKTHGEAGGIAVPPGQGGCDLLRATDQQAIDHRLIGRPGRREREHQTDGHHPGRRAGEGQPPVRPVISPKAMMAT